MRKQMALILATMMLLVVAFSVQTVNAQTTSTSIQIKERLPDGEYIVSIYGVEQRTITVEHARQIAARNEELDKLKRAQPLYEAQISQLKLAIDLAKKDALLATTQASFERERAEKFQALFNGEQALRLQGEKLMARGSVSKFFDNPFVQVSLKLAQPIVQTILTARRE